MSAVVQHEETAPDTQAMNATGNVTDGASAALAILRGAIANPDMPESRIDKALDWMDRLEGKAAREAFNKAFAAMQGDLPAVQMRGVGHNQRRYATLSDITAATRPALAAHGFGVQFQTEVLEKAVRVKAILRHTDGHEEANEGIYPFDGSGSKNGIQSIGSAETYGKRYTVSGLLNIVTTEEEEDDGAAAGGGSITEEQVSELAGLLADADADQQAFLRWAGVERLMDLPSAKYGSAQAMLQTKLRQSQKGGEQ